MIDRDSVQDFRVKSIEDFHSCLLDTSLLPHYIYGAKENNLKPPLFHRSKLDRKKLEQRSVREVRSNSTRILVHLVLKILEAERQLGECWTRQIHQLPRHHY